MKSTPTSGLRRIAAFGLGLAMVGGLSFVAAAPASAVPVPSTYAVTGTVSSVTATGHGPLAGAEFAVDGGQTAVTDNAGAFALSVEDGHYTYTISAVGYLPHSGDFDVVGADIDFGEFNLSQDLPPAPATYSISGVVTAKDANPDFAPSLTLSGIAGSSPIQIEADADGTFTFDHLAPSADLSLLVYAEGYGPEEVSVPITNADVTLTVVLLPKVAAGTVSISGSVAAGSTLTAVAAGWPAGTTFSYQWGAVGPRAQNSGDIQGANASTLIVTSDMVNKMIWVQIVGHLDGFADRWVYPAFTLAPQLPTAAAPVASSADLAAFLEFNRSTPASQTSTGLPAGALNPAQSYTANVQFAGSDRFVDAYLYSSPVSVGTFPVVNGVAQITLSPSVLSQLAAGSHTLVVVGQFNGEVSSVALSVAAASTTAAGTTASLAATGFNPAAPFGAAALFVLLGAALVLRRRSLHA